MRSNIKINYSTLEDIAQKTYDYKIALDDINEAINNINIMLEERNSGEAIDALKECYNDLKSDIESCYNEVNDLHTIFDDYITEMTSIIKPKNESAPMVVGRTDIYMNMESIIGDCRTEIMIKSNSGTYMSFPNFFESDEEKENAKNNYNKFEEIWEIIRRYETSLTENIDDLNNLFNTKIVAYEDLDDSFKGRASQLYDEQSTFAEKIESNVISYAKDTLNEAEGFLNSVKSGIIGLGKLLTLPQNILFNIWGAALGYLWISETGDAPEVLQNCIDTVESDIKIAQALLDDPTLLEEGIAQVILDTYENEGLAYCVGYVKGEIAQILLLDNLDVFSGVGKADKVLSEEDVLSSVVNKLNKIEYKGIKGNYVTKEPATIAQYLKQEEIAEEMYNTFRNTSEDIAKISENTGWSVEDVTRIKNHMFLDELRLDSGISRLAPDYEMANAWKRLIDGNFYENDILLMKHELYESTYYDLYKCTQREAHDHTLEYFDWATTIYEN